MLSKLRNFTKIPGLIIILVILFLIYSEFIQDKNYVGNSGKKYEITTISGSDNLIAPSPKSVAFPDEAPSIMAMNAAKDFYSNVDETNKAKMRSDFSSTGSESEAISNFALLLDDNYKLFTSVVEINTEYADARLDVGQSTYQGLDYGSTDIAGSLKGENFEPSYLENESNSRRVNLFEEGGDSENEQKKTIVGPGSNYTDSFGNTSYYGTDGLSGRAYTDSFGNTNYYGNDGYSARSYSDSFGNTTTYDNRGDSVRSYTNSFGNTNYYGSDGYSARSYTDSFGNTNYYDNSGNSMRCYSNSFGSTNCY